MIRRPTDRRATRAWSRRARPQGDDGRDQRETTAARAGGDCRWVPSITTSQGEAMSSPDQAAPATRNRLPVSRARRTAGVLLAALAVVAVPLAALAGCGTAGSAAGTPGLTVQQQARTVWLHYARCVREHGAPNFPDPQVDSQGRASFGQ